MTLLTKIITKITFTALALALTLALTLTSIPSAEPGGHLDNVLLPEGCGSCHIGHGIADQPMLTHSEEDACYQCHGSDSKQSAMKSSGKLAESAKLANIEREFNKPYRHPVTEGFGHSPSEELSGALARGASHAECVDCHNPHQRVGSTNEQGRDVSGLSLSRQYLAKSTYEYQTCMKCHTGFAGLQSAEGDMARTFSAGVTSQHPVTSSNSGIRSISLTNEAAMMIRMKCTDCHTNDDPNGPKGPHGSRYEFMLSSNYNTDSYASESPYNYAFCYSCHDRQSILGNESFPLHREHIEGDPLENIAGTSCYTCHSSHSSRNHNDLIRFSPEVVSRDSFGRLEYISNGEGSGSCYLKCHDYDHKPEKY